MGLGRGTARLLAQGAALSEILTRVVGPFLIRALRWSGFERRRLIWRSWPDDGDDVPRALYRGDGKRGAFSVDSRPAADFMAVYRASSHSNESGHGKNGSRRAPCGCVDVGGGESFSSGSC